MGCWEGFVQCCEKEREIHVHNCDVIKKPLLKGTAGKLKRKLEDSNKLESEDIVDGMLAQASM